MAYRTFAWRPSFDANQRVTHRTLDVQFGDGYEQSVGDGINTRREAWSLTFEGKSEKINAIKTFLDEHKGYIPFYWTTSNGDSLLVKSKGGYSQTRRSSRLGTDVVGLTVTFEETF